MMRRLSSFKTAPKSLLDYIDIDQELYGYENEAAVFHDDDEEENDLDSVDNILDYAHNTPTLNESRHDVNFNVDDSVESAASSDSECGSPTPQKKGLRRFFCMPGKSIKTRKLKSGKSFGKSKKDQQESLLQ